MIALTNSERLVSNVTIHTNFPRLAVKDGFDDGLN